MLDFSQLLNHEQAEPQEEPELFGEMPVQLTQAEYWANYTDDELYEMDKLVRQFLKKTYYMRRNKGKFETTAPLVFAFIYGRPPRPEDGAKCRMLNMLLEYYCKDWRGPTTFQGKKASRVYSLTTREARRAYSLRLRIEEEGDHESAWRENPNAGKSKRRKTR